MAQWSHIHSTILTIVEAVLGSFDDLVLLHLGHSLHLAVLVLTEDAACHALSASGCVVLRHLSSSILILTVALDTLHIEVTSIETICQVIDIVK